MRYTYELLDGSKVIAFNSLKQAQTYANKTNRKLAEYGDVYGSNIAYAIFNKSGNRNDTEELVAYYQFNSSGKPKTLAPQEFINYLTR